MAVSGVRNWWEASAAKRCWRSKETCSRVSKSLKVRRQIVQFVVRARRWEALAEIGGGNEVGGAGHARHRRKSFVAQPATDRGSNDPNSRRTKR